MRDGEMVVGREKGDWMLFFLTEALILDTLTGID